jgi:SnoaL-like polyketide cyclase.
MTTPVALVRRYLDAMAARDWDTLRATLASDVVRRGPFNDDFHSRDEYVAFLARTFAWMQDYTLDVARVWGTDERVCAELAETVTLDGRRLRTDEAIVFEITGPTITRVSVFLRQSYEPTQ